MDLHGRTIALYGRFSSGVRAKLAGGIESRGGRIARDLTRATDCLVVGAHADSLIAGGVLPARLAMARSQAKPVFGESAFGELLGGVDDSGAANLPLSTALSQSGASDEDALLLAAFDLIRLADEHCRFGDVAILRTAASLRAAGCEAAQLIRTLQAARRLAPKGRHKIVLGPDGEPALLWEDGVSTLSGQGLLPLDLSGGNLDDLFEAAVLAQADGRLEEAERLFDMCARADPKDAIALYNLGNVLLNQSRWDEAALAYRRALARDERLVEARYNLAQALEAEGRHQDAEQELLLLLEADPSHADATFNLAQLLLDRDQLAEAKALYERYLEMSPPEDWARKARNAIAYCARSL